MSDAMGVSGGVGVRLGSAALVFSRRTVKAAALQRLLAVGRQSGAVARAVDAVKLLPGLTAGVKAMGRLDAARGGKVLRVVPSAAVVRSGRGSASPEEISRARPRADLAAAWLGKAALRNVRALTIPKARDGGAGRADAAVKADRGWTAVNGMTMGRVGRTARAPVNLAPVNLAPVNLAPVMRSAAPVKAHSGVARQGEAAAILGDQSQARVPARGNGDVQRRVTDRWARQASLPPAGASGFDARLGPDWYGVGSFG